MQAENNQIPFLLQLLLFCFCFVFISHIVLLILFLYPTLGMLLLQ